MSVTLAHLSSIAGALPAISEHDLSCEHHNDLALCPRISILSNETWGLPYERESQRLSRLRRFNIHPTLTEQIYEDIASIALTICDAQLCFINLVYQDTVIIKSAYTREGPLQNVVVLNREDSFCSFTVIEEVPIVVEDVSKDVRFSCSPHGAAFKFYAGIPLTTDDGCIGTICVVDPSPRLLTTDQRDSLLALSKQLVDYLELKLCNDDIRTSKIELQMKNENLKAVSNERNLMLGIIGHDIRQPLCSVQVSSELLAEEVKTSNHAGALELLESIQSSAEFMNYLMDSMLHVIGTDSIQHNVEMDMKLVDPLAVINKNVSANIRVASRKDIVLSLKVDESLAEDYDIYKKAISEKKSGDSRRASYDEFMDAALGDRRVMVVMDMFRIEQVLNNLISNAIKFSYANSQIEVLVQRVWMPRFHLQKLSPLSSPCASPSPPINPSLRSLMNKPSTPRASFDYSSSLDHKSFANLPEPDTKGFAEYLAISVRDQGQGIPSEELEYVFEASRKKSIKPTASEVSTGLGLSIVKQIVVEHKGAVHCESVVGAGTTFFVYLPIATRDQMSTRHKLSSPVSLSAFGSSTLDLPIARFGSADFKGARERAIELLELEQRLRNLETNDETFIPPPTSHSNSSTSLLSSNASPFLPSNMSSRQDSSNSLTSSGNFTFDLPSTPLPVIQQEESELSQVPHKILNILIAEDNPLNRKLVEAILVKRGHKVISAADGQQAVDMFNETIDIVMLDQEMPILSGFEATKLIQSKRPSIPIISMSGNSLEPEELYERSGIRWSIKKPFKVKQLINVVEECYKEFERDREDN